MRIHTSRNIIQFLKGHFWSLKLMQKFQTLWSFYQASDKKYVKMQWELMNHTYLHPILQNQIFPKWWWCLAEVFITEIDNLWPTRHGGRDRPRVTYATSLGETVLHFHQHGMSHRQCHGINCAYTKGKERNIILSPGARTSHHFNDVARYHGCRSSTPLDSTAPEHHR